LRRSSFPAAVVVAATALAAGSAPASRPEDPLPLDPGVRLGELDNGFRYAIRPNAKPEHRAELRLVVLAGSVEEDEDQRGLAHFVEHMPFNGTKSRAGNEIIAYLESVGARFGADLNAYTSFDETVYLLQIPTDREGLLREGLHVLSEFAHAATLATSEIEKERGVVLDEWRRGLGAGSRIRDAQLPVLLRGSRYADRLPIGDPEVLRGCDPDAIRRFYRDWYQPERMALVAVGDLDPSRVAAWVTEFFGAIPPATELRERPARDVPAWPDTLFALAQDPELRGTTIAASRKLPAPDDESTRGGYRRSLVRQAALRMFNARLAELARSGDPPFLDAGFGTQRFGRTDLPGPSARVPDGGERRGLEALLVEERRALRHGFAATELDRARREMLAGIEASWAERAKTQSGSYAAEYVRHFAEGEPIPGIDFERDLWNEELPAVTLEECQAAFAELATAGGLVIRGARPASAEGPSEGELLALLRDVSARDVAPWVDDAGGAALVADPRPAGRVVERRLLEEIGVTELTLSNGCRVFVKPTDFQDDTVLLEGTALGGTSMVEDAQLASAEAVGAIVAESGFGGHSAVQLEKLLAGRVASVAPYFQDRHHGVSGSSTVADLPTALDLAVLAMTAPNRDPAAFGRVLSRMRASLANRASDPAARYADRLTAINTCDHPRTRPMTVDRLGEIDLDAALGFYRRCFANPADFAFFLVGNVDPAAIEKELERTIGSLPASTGERSAWVDREVLFPTDPVRATVRAGREPRATTTLTFAAYDGSDPHEWHRVRTACSILERRLRERLREDRGATYGVGVGYLVSLIGPARGRVAVRFGSDPAEAETLAVEVQRAIRELQEAGPTADEVAKERELQLREVEVGLEQNGFWLGNLSALWLRDRPLTEIRDRRPRIEALDAAELHRVFREDLDPGRFTWVDWLPDPGAGKPEPGPRGGGAEDAPYCRDGVPG
jgi:zinc protease